MVREMDAFQQALVRLRNRPRRPVTAWSESVCQLCAMAAQDSQSRKNQAILTSEQQRISQSSSVCLYVTRYYFFDIFFLRIQITVFRAECSLCVLSSIPSVCSTYRFKSSHLQYFPLICVLRNLHPRSSCESVSAQYLLVLATCWLQATRGMGVALLQVTAHRNIQLQCFAC
jgi:hypothetical protein